MFGKTNCIKGKQLLHMQSFNIGYSVMACLLYLAIVGIQLTSTWAAGTVPLTCFLQNQNFFNIFSRQISSQSEFTPYAIPTNTAQFDSLRINKINLMKDGWSFNTNDLVFKGLKEAVIDDFGFNFESNISHITFHTDMSVTCHYKSSGVLFSLPISGEGPCTVFLKNIKFGMIMPFNVIEESGHKIINLRSFNYFYDVKDGANITLSNLYYGDHELSERMHHLMNNHWKFITERYSPIFIEAVAKNIFDMFKNNLLEKPLKSLNTC